MILQKIPVWSYFVSQKMDQVRVQFDAKDVPVAIGGVTVHPGDVIVADGDGVIVVPRKIAKDVAKYAHKELYKDKNAKMCIRDSTDFMCSLRSVSAILAVICFLKITYGFGG